MGGRNPTRAAFDVGFTPEGLIQGLELRLWVLGGAYADTGGDGGLMKAEIDMVRGLLQDSFGHTII